MHLFLCFVFCVLIDFNPGIITLWPVYTFTPWWCGATKRFRNEFCLKIYKVKLVGMKSYFFYVHIVGRKKYLIDIFKSFSL